MNYDGQRALELLRLGSGLPEATFRAGQEEAIRHVVEGRGRLLVVQRTGWGKSFVYFIALKLLRDGGMGPALLVSPLLALMRNQMPRPSGWGCGRRRSTPTTRRSGSAWNQVQEIFSVLEEAEAGLPRTGLLDRVNIQAGRLDQVLKILSLESPAPVVKEGPRWQLTASLRRHGSGEVWPLALAQA